MTCAACQRKNPPDSLFCDACGAELQRAHALYVEIGATGHAEWLARELGA